MKNSQSKGSKSGNQIKIEGISSNSKKSFKESLKSKLQNKIKNIDVISKVEGKIEKVSFSKGDRIKVSRAQWNPENYKDGFFTGVIIQKVHTKSNKKGSYYSVQFDDGENWNIQDECLSFESDEMANKPKVAKKNMVAVPNQAKIDLNKMEQSNSESILLDETLVSVYKDSDICLSPEVIVSENSYVSNTFIENPSLALSKLYQSSIISSTRDIDTHICSLFPSFANSNLSNPIHKNKSFALKYENFLSTLQDDEYVKHLDYHEDEGSIFNIKQLDVYIHK